MGRYALGLDFGTESLRALAVDCENGEEVAEVEVPYAHGVITENLPGVREPLPQDFALQNPDDFIDGSVEAISEVIKVVSPEDIVGIGVDFTACTIFPAPSTKK